jgi:hypothetical protein
MKKNKIKVLDPDQHFLSNPQLYWGKKNPNTEDYRNGLQKSLEILKCQDVLTMSYNDWNIVGSKVDWIKTGLPDGKTENELFEKGGGFPEAGPNVIRTEYFIRLYTDHVVLWRNNKLNQIKGNIDDGLLEFLKENYTDYVTLAFKANNES